MIQFLYLPRQIWCQFFATQTCVALLYVHLLYGDESDIIINTYWFIPYKQGGNNLTFSRICLLGKLRGGMWFKTDVSGLSSVPVLKGQAVRESWPSKTVQICSPETSVLNHFPSRSFPRRQMPRSNPYDGRIQGLEALASTFTWYWREEWVGIYLHFSLQFGDVLLD